MAFSLENIPYGIASSAVHSIPQHVTRYGDDVVFLAVLQQQGFFGHVASLPVGIFAQVSSSIDFCSRFVEKTKQKKRERKRPKKTIHTEQGLTPSAYRQP